MLDVIGLVLMGACVALVIWAVRREANKRNF